MRAGLCAGYVLLFTVSSSCGGGDPSAPSAGARSLAPGLSIVSGNGQSAIAGAALQNRLVVQLANPSGVPVPNAAITFQAGAGGGTLDPITAVTGADGIASSSLTLSLYPGPVAVTVTAAGLPNAPVTFTVSSRLDFATLSAGGSHTCATTTSGSYCWGDNGSGELGDGTLTSRSVPTPVIPDGPPFSQLSLSNSSTCGIIGAGALSCWGANFSGSLGDGTTTLKRVPTPVLTPGATRYSVVAAGASHTCAEEMLKGDVYCWGANTNGEVGDGTLMTRLLPTRVPSSIPLFNITAGDRHTCALGNSGVVYCWGYSGEGQTGVGVGGLSDHPVAVGARRTPVLSFVNVSAGGAHTCARTPASDVYCWGRNVEGQLGTGETRPQQDVTQVLVPAGITFVSLSLGRSHTCAISSTRQLYCWGNNFSGQLGDGTTTNRSVPVPVAGVSDLLFKSVAAGGDHTCGLTDDAVYCWGYNFHGQLGDGTTVNRLLPVRVKAQ